MSIEEKYDEIRALMAMGKEKGYLLYEEINELLPADVTSAEELDDLFSALGSAGIEIVDSEKSYRDEKPASDDGEGPQGDLDLTPGVLDKTNDPVRMYLREMGTVPLLTREGEVAIAKRIERGKLTVMKLISRTPKVTQEVIEMGEQLKRGERTIRELVVFNEEEITDEKLERRRKQLRADGRASHGRYGGDRHVFEFVLQDIQHGVDVVHSLRCHLGGVQQLITDGTRGITHAIDVGSHARHNGPGIANHLIRVLQERSDLAAQALDCVVQRVDSLAHRKQQQHKCDERTNAQQQHQYLQNPAGVLEEAANRHRPSNDRVRQRGCLQQDRRNRKCKGHARDIGGAM